MKEEEIIHKWLDHEELTKEELEAFQHMEGYASFMKISENARTFKSPTYSIPEELEKIKAYTKPHKKVSFSTSSIRMIMRIAAIFILGIGMYFTFFNESTITKQTLISEKASTTLPDQTMVTLNSLSSVRYKEKDWDENRKIELDGEAYFKVAKGKKFDVITSAGIVRVLGTQFAVKQRKDYFEVICYEGLVRVLYKNKTSELPAGSIFRVVKGEVSNSTTSFTKPSWIKNRSVFNSTPYRYILREFERQYNVKITTKNIDQDKLFTGNFVHSDIQTALQSITIPMRLEYKMNDNHVTLYHP
ncbi:FecR family protein [Aquimarina sp. U1-2]|uniref:FecR family protein n=1 Tax=Aquimarina sp. U1-2 TaxID=2823141 RepID=UPI001AECCC97|nr:FecR family protein [Aquimarina sp. U1-2]MBP2830906.1 FecR family protein [Aquimarina sp. U1-2]